MGGCLMQNWRIDSHISAADLRLSIPMGIISAKRRPAPVNRPLSKERRVRCIAPFGYSLTIGAIHRTLPLRLLL